MSRCDLTSLRCLSVAAALVFAASPGVEAQEPLSSGTGFYVNAAGWVMTNAHVVEGCAQVEIRGDQITANILRDADSDLALLHTGRPSPAVSLAFREHPARLAEPLLAVGYPLTDILSEEVRVTTGSVSARSGPRGDARYLQVSAPLQPGNSGGPILDAEGRVLGIATAVLSEDAYARAQNVNFAISAAEALRFLATSGISHEVAPTEAAGGAHDPADIAEAAAAATVLIRCHGYGPSFRPATGAVAQPGLGMVVEDGIDILGHDYQLLRGASLGSCQSACEGDARCRAFTFNRRHGACFLKDDARFLAQNRDAVGGIDRRLEPGVLRSSFRVMADSDAVGGDYARIRDAGFLGCIAECAQDLRCRAFAYVRGQRDCWLKDQVGPIAPQPGVELGLR